MRAFLCAVLASGFLSCAGSANVSLDSVIFTVSRGEAVQGGKFCGRHGKNGTQGNYKHVVTLPRDGENAAGPPTELERLVADHNRSLSENPGKKNVNRVVYLSGPRRYQPVPFPVEPGVVLVDGLGKTIGPLEGGVHSVMLNFGQRKRIADRDYIYAFSTRVQGIGGASGWIPESGLSPSPASREYDAIIKMDVHAGPEGGDAPERYQIVGDASANWKDDRLKVNPNIDGRKEKHICASDYVTRPGGIVYLLYSLPRHGGVATDSFLTGAEFVPSAGVPRALLPLYLPIDATPAEQQAWDTKLWPHVMEFAYGRVGDRYGWIAATDLKPVTGR